jgi:hypothetical protein
MTPAQAPPDPPPAAPPYPAQPPAVQAPAPSVPSVPAAVPQPPLRVSIPADAPPDASRSTPIVQTREIRKEVQVEQTMTPCVVFQSLLRWTFRVAAAPLRTYFVRSTRILLATTTMHVIATSVPNHRA